MKSCCSWIRHQIKALQPCIFKEVAKERAPREISQNAVFHITGEEARSALFQRKNQHHQFLREHHANLQFGDEKHQIIAEREARQVIESQCRFCICIYICCNAGRGSMNRGRDSINMNGGRGIPATFELRQPAGWRGWQEERSNSLEGRKPVVQRHRN